MPHLLLQSLLISCVDVMATSFQLQIEVEFNVFAYLQDKELVLYRSWKGGRTSS